MKAKPFNILFMLRLVVCNTCPVLVTAKDISNVILEKNEKHKQDFLCKDE